VELGQTTPENRSATVGYEAQLWEMADALRGSMDAAEYKHVVLGLIFSDAFEEQHAKLEAERAHGADPEDPDEYRAINIFWVPPEARWAHLKAQARQPTIGRLVDDAMTAIERANPELDKSRLGQLIDLISNIVFRSDQPSPPAPLPVGEGGRRPGEGQVKRGAFDLLGRVYEYFLSQFASAEGKKGGEFYTRAAWSSFLSRCSSPTTTIAF
jgi:type I restriction enzyme M protein